MLCRVDHRHKHGSLHQLGQLHGDAVERVEGVALLVAPRTRQGRTELGLEHGLHEGIIASNVVGQRLGSDHFVRSTVVVLERGIDYIKGWKILFVLF